MMDTGEFVNGESLESAAKVPGMTLFYISVITALTTGLHKPRRAYRLDY